jgi:hypothetical protein
MTSEYALDIHFSLLKTFDVNVELVEQLGNQFVREFNAKYVVVTKAKSYLAHRYFCPHFQTLFCNKI